ALPAAPGPHRARATAAFLSLAGTVVWHSDPQRFARLYEALWRLDRGEDALHPADPQAVRLNAMAQAVRRDMHKMKAFVRFRELQGAGARRRFAAWFEPDHHSLEPTAPFFARRFGDMDWSIATPALTVRCVDGALDYAQGGAPPDLPSGAGGDASEALWEVYFANIFNPARIKLNAMRAHMPKKYWRNLPETKLIPEMLADAEARVQRMHEAGASTPRRGAAAISTRYRAAQTPPEPPADLAAARLDAQSCTRCDLCGPATQTVWGEGPPDARLMVVGEQPGDEEDRAGRPFIGPAGTLLRASLAEAGLDPRDLWLTNAVKHFKFRRSGKRRLHQNPTRGEIEHCRWWLGLEVKLIKPRVIIALGASAAFALTGDKSPLGPRRGTVEQSADGTPVLITWHPAFALRSEAEAAARIRAEMVDDLRAAAARAA
ncbi:MAG: UdgX family uracil-DNA binding protein, partial [Paracoccus sp. (in: a-proteobacteria)]|nr:UdgX family uracil-DNA binding protein [Paracoccus sp. (in: a-proteobacteria)]